MTLKIPQAIWIFIRIIITYSMVLLAPVVQKVDSAIRWINLFPVDNATSFPNAYPLDSDLSGG